MPAATVNNNHDSMYDRRAGVEPVRQITAKAKCTKFTVKNIVRRKSGKRGTKMCNKKVQIRQSSAQLQLAVLGGDPKCDPQ